MHITTEYDSMQWCVVLVTLFIRVIHFFTKTVKKSLRRSECSPQCDAAST